MKLGHFGALCCFVLALVGAGAVYWDLQDGYFSVQLLFLPIGLGTMGVALLLFPGGPTTFREAALGAGSRGSYRVPPLHRRVWLLAAGLGIYLTFWAQSYLEGKHFFTFGEQVLFFAAAGVMWLMLRKQLRQLW